MPLAAALLCCACNQVYGLDPTTIREVGIDAPPDLEDEDLDTIPNEFDNCPGLPNTDQADRDGDQVGDTCDRLVDSPTEHIEARAMFNRPALDADDWSGSGWEFREGYVIQPTFGGSATMFMNRTFQGASLLVEARMTPVSVDRTNIANKLALVMEGLGGDECLVTSSFMGSNGLYAATAGNSVGNGLPAIDDNVVFVLRASSVRLQTPQVVPNIYCSIGAIRHGVDTLMKIPGPVGLYVKFAAARIDYVVVYSSAVP